MSTATATKTPPAAAELERAAISNHPDYYRLGELMGRLAVMQRDLREFAMGDIDEELLAEYAGESFGLRDRLTALAINIEDTLTVWSSPLPV
jgi:hypothetical protein